MAMTETTNAKRPFRWHILVFLAPAVLVYSAFAADEFTRLVERMPDTSAFDHATFIAISPRVGTHLPSSFRDSVLVAAEPNEDAMLSLL